MVVPQGEGTGEGLPAVDPGVVEPTVQEGNEPTTLEAPPQDEAVPALIPVEGEVEPVQAVPSGGELLAACLAELDNIDLALQDEDSGRALVLIDMARDSCEQAARNLAEAAVSETDADPSALNRLWQLQLRRAAILARLESCQDAQRLMRSVSSQVALPSDLVPEFARVAYDALRCGPRPGEATHGTINAVPGFGELTFSGTTVAEVEATTIASHCVGSIPQAPSFTMTVSEAMQISVSAYSYSGSDLVLLVTDGLTTFCNDDWDGLNPGLSEFFPAGSYSVFVGQYSGYEASSDFTLIASSEPIVASTESYPTYGTAYVGPGYGRTTMSGSVWGVNDAAGVFDPSTVGWISSEPDYQLYVEGSGEVWVNVTGAPGTDLTLIVDGPGGRHFNDDAMGASPALHAVMTPGSYNVWIGDKAGAGTGASYGIQFSSYDPMLTLETEPSHGVADLTAVGVPVVLSGTTTGLLPMGDFFGTSCYGTIPMAPSHRLVLPEDGMVEVVARATYSGDLVIAVTGPTGVYCNDDYEGLNPGVRRWLNAGEYLVYVGELSASPTGTLFSTTFNRIAGSAPPTFATVTTGVFGTVSVGSASGSTTLSGTSGGTEQASNIDPSCRGYISVEPSFIMDVMDYTTVAIQVLAVGDTTLVVMGADGTVTCNDDAVGFNPSVSQYFNAGRYGVWIGNYSSGEGVPFMINFNPTYWY